MTRVCSAKIAAIVLLVLTGACSSYDKDLTPTVMDLLKSQLSPEGMTVFLPVDYSSALTAESSFYRRFQNLRIYSSWPVRIDRNYRVTRQSSEGITVYKLHASERSFDVFLEAGKDRHVVCYWSGPSADTLVVCWAEPYYRDKLLRGGACSQRELALGLAGVFQLQLYWDHMQQNLPLENCTQHGGVDKDTITEAQLKSKDSTTELSFAAGAECTEYATRSSSLINLELRNFYEDVAQLSKSDNYASWVLGVLSFYGLGCALQQKESIRLWKAAAMEGCYESILSLAIVYHYGTPDIEKDENLYRKYRKKLSAIENKPDFAPECLVTSSETARMAEKCIEISGVRRILEDSGEEWVIGTIPPW